MAFTLEAQVPRDGSLALTFAPQTPPGSITLLLVRTGSVPAFTSLSLAGDTRTYQIDNLSRHQRYRVAALGTHDGGCELSRWLAVTPRRGLAPVLEQEEGLAPYLARVEGVTLMPQDGRLTVYWRRTPGFVDQILLELFDGDQPWKSLELEPEVSSIALDARRGVPLRNGHPYAVRVSARFAVHQQEVPLLHQAIPAAQGDERAQNRELPQTGLVYPCLTLAPEVRVFPEELSEPAAETPPTTVHCCRCRAVVEWHAWRLVCGGCGAEFIPNGRGDFLDVARLRFGTCRCCLPQKILIQRPGADGLTCAHSGKEHIRLGRAGAYALIEDLPFGLCQCCRPRRPLSKKSERVACSKSGEGHRNEHGRWVLVPSAPVFDAAAIDDLLDAGLAEICSTGVSRGSASPRRRR